MEKLLHERLYNFQKKQKLLYEQQYGFRNKSYSNHELISVNEKIRPALVQNTFVSGIFIIFKSI